MYVQFSDETETKIVSEFGSPQSPEYYKFLGEVEEDDPRYIEFKERSRKWSWPFF